MLTLPEALQPLGAYRQFVAYVVVPSKTRPGKTDKFPISCATWCVADAHDPAAWGTFEQASAIAQQLGPGHGVGFVFTDADPFWFLDVDSAAVNGQWSPLAQSLCQQLAGAGVEVSTSGRGLHLIGTLPAEPLPTFKCVGKPGLGIEFYTRRRFVALCGQGATGSVLYAPQHLAQVLGQHFDLRDANERDDGWRDGPVPEWAGPTDDAELIDRARRSRSAGNALGGHASFDDLWTGNEAALAATWPDSGGAGKPYDASRADGALAQHLAFWTGNDCERMARLMRQSALVREKWDRDDYFQGTILGACARQTTWCGDRPAPTEPQLAEPVAPVQPGASLGQTEQRVGYQFLGLDQQLEYFAGCVYVCRPHAVLTPTRGLMKPDQFKAYYGGYAFALDARNTRTGRNAWEAFVDNQGLRWPRADDLVFLPQLAPGAVVEREGRTLVNSWRPIEVPRAKGDPSRFLQHLAKLLPEPGDQASLLAYMAGVVQYPGVKFQWCPLVQGVEGNGKTLLSRCVAAAVGERYSVFPRAKQIVQRFNDWLNGSIFAGIEDIYVAESQQDVIEELKPMITSDMQEIEGKGEKKETLPVCTNFMLNSNHKNAIRKTRNDRRFAVYFTAQQDAADLQRDGMTGDYFPDLYDWLRGSGRYAGQPSGYAIVTDYLLTYAIPDELNPATRCQRAPETSSIAEALEAGMGTIEQEILEAIESGRPGFAGGWVSSMALDRLLDHLRASRVFPPNKRRELMSTLGYDHHPGLPGGRVPCLVLPDQGRPRLYIRRGHLAANLTGPTAIAEAYSAAQMPQPTGGVAAQVFAS